MERDAGQKKENAESLGLRSPKADDGDGDGLFWSLHQVGLEWRKCVLTKNLRSAGLRESAAWLISLLCSR